MSSNKCEWSSFWRVSLALLVLLVMTSVRPARADWLIKTYRNGNAVNNLSDADALISGTTAIASTNIAVADLLGEDPGSGSGRFSINNSVPGIPQNQTTANYAVQGTGFLEIGAPGIYTFGLNTDDGARLRIDGVDVVVDDAQHGPSDSTYATVSLTAGLHAIEWTWFNAGGGAEGEAFAAPGQSTSFNSSFTLLGDLNGLPVVQTNAPLPPHITTQPVSQCVQAGSSATFIVAASGQPPLYFQWHFNDFSIPNATNATLTLNSVGVGNTGFYSVTVSNNVASTNSVAASLIIYANSLAQGWTIKTYRDGSSVNGLADADRLITNTLPIATDVIQEADLLGFNSGEGTGHFSINAPVPGITQAQATDNYAVQGTGFLVVPASGTYTFGLNTDDGGRLRIDGTNVIVDDVRSPPHDSAFVPVFLAAGVHAVEWTWYNEAGGDYGGGAEGEAFAAPGVHTSFDSSFHLLGDPNGLAVYQGLALDAVVSNVRASQRTAATLVDIYFDLSGSSPAYSVSVSVSSDGGASFTVPATHFTGDGVTSPLAPGVSRHIAWDAGADFPGQFSTKMRLRLAVGSNFAVSPIFTLDTRAVPAGTLTGLVQGNSAPLANAQVRIDGTPFSTSTDANGSFTLASVPAGSGYLLKVSAAGFASKSVPGITVTAGTTDLGTIALGATTGPYQVIPLAPDVNPATTTVEQGGTAYRYYLMQNSAGQPQGGVAVSVQVAGGSPIPQVQDVSGYWPGQAAGTSDADGIVRIAIPSSALGTPGTIQTIQLSLSGQVQQTFQAQAVPRQYDQVWKQILGGGVSVGELLTAEADTSAESDLRHQMSNGTVVGETISRIRQAKLKAGVEFDLGPSLTATLSPPKAGAGVSVGTTLSSTYSFDPNTTDPSTNAMKLYVDLGNVLSGLPGPAYAFYQFVETTIEPSFLGSNLADVEADVQGGIVCRCQLDLGLPLGQNTEIGIKGSALPVPMPSTATNRPLAVRMKRPPSRGWRQPSQPIFPHRRASRRLGGL